MPAGPGCVRQGHPCVQSLIEYHPRTHNCVQCQPRLTGRSHFAYRYIVRCALVGKSRGVGSDTACSSLSGAWPHDARATAAWHVHDQPPVEEKGLRQQRCGRRPTEQRDSQRGTAHGACSRSDSKRVWGIFLLQRNEASEGGTRTAFDRASAAVIPDGGWLGGGPSWRCFSSATPITSIAC